MTYEIGYSKTTGEYYVVSHDGLTVYGDYESKEEAEEKVRELEQAEAQQAMARVQAHWARQNGPGLPA